jgi:peptidylamidoglycolate lyase
MAGRLSSTYIVSVFTLILVTTLSSSFGQGNAGYEVDESWADIPGGEWNGSTSWVAVDGNGHVLVMVRSAPYFRLFDRNGDFIRAWGEDGTYNNAHSVTFDNDGNVWATGAARHVVHKYSIEGNLLMTLGAEDETGDNTSHSLFNQPNHVFVADNGEIYVSDGYQNSRVVHFAGNGDFIRVIGGELGSGDYQFDIPHGVALDSKGRILVNDSGNQRISAFDSSGEFLEAWPFPSRGGIVVMADDSVYVSDVNAGAVNILRDGKLVNSITVDARPHGLAVDTDGTVYVSDARGHKVIRIKQQ